MKREIYSDQGAPKTYLSVKAVFFVLMKHVNSANYIFWERSNGKAPFHLNGSAF